MRRSLPLCYDGKAKSFNKNADGTVRSECINVLLLQKAKSAKRIYAEVCQARCIFDADSKEMFGPQRSVSNMKNFFTEFYREANISPNQIEYLEGYGTGMFLNYYSISKSKKYFYCYKKYQKSIFITINQNVIEVIIFGIKILPFQYFLQHNKIKVYQR